MMLSRAVIDAKLAILSSLPTICSFILVASVVTPLLFTLDTKTDVIISGRQSDRVFRYETRRDVEDQDINASLWFQPKDRQCKVINLIGMALEFQGYDLMVLITAVDFSLVGIVYGVSDVPLETFVQLFPNIVVSNRSSLSLEEIEYFTYYRRSLWSGVMSMDLCPWLD
jgi:hypothetical protein